MAAHPGFKALGSFLGGGNAPNAAIAEAQGEQLGASTQDSIAQALLRQQELQGRGDVGPTATALLQARENSRPAPAPPPGIALPPGLDPGSAPSSVNPAELGAFLGAQARGHIDLEQGPKAIGEDQANRFRALIGDVNASEPSRVAAAQAVVPAGLANPLTDANQQLALARASQANAGATRAPFQNRLDTAHAGYFDRSPGAGMAPGIPPLSPELQMHVDQGLLDPRTITSRNVGVLDQIAKQHPEGFDFNASHANSVMQSNATFQQRSATLNTIPGNIEHLVELGSKLDYSPVRFAGAAEAWMKGELNDPTLTEYMTVRNDTLLKLAAVMRGVGASNQALKAENEVMHPTMNPAALEAWARGQMSVIGPQREQNQQLQHRNLHPGAPLPTAAAGAAPAAGGLPPGWTVEAH